ncbi:MAG: redox-regulated ATPase YchF [Deltaproteobacteria bacterium]|nr:redox-regulated ATPase YchF [Deltaproteobacteria bacterium]
MKVALCGFPGSGKTTVFNALTGLQAQVGLGAKTGKQNLGVVKVPDARVAALAKLYQPKKTTYAEVSFVDVAAGGTGRGLDVATIAAMREGDALSQVARAFVDPQVEASAAADPLREIRDFESEMNLADLMVIEKKVERLRKGEKGQPREQELLERMKAHLEAEKPLRELPLAADEWAQFSGYRFLSQKPLLLVLNVAEEEVTKPAPAPIAAHATEHGLGLLVLSGKVEMDIAQLDPTEQPDFARSLGLDEPAAGRFVRSAYALLDLVSFLTVGPDEVRAWTIRRGTRAREAAGKIHTDLERGFIRAEVTRHEDLLALGSEARCREAGKLRTEGKDYVVLDGDVMHVRFAV